MPPEDPFIASAEADLAGHGEHNSLDLQCRRDEEGTDYRKVAGARCWVCRPARPGELGPARHAEDSEETAPDPAAVKILGAGTRVFSDDVEGWDAFLESQGQVDVNAVAAIGRALLVAIGEDPDREGLRDTPARWARMWSEFIDYRPGTIGTVFDGISTDQLVVVRGVTVWSLCEHHLVPFKTTLTMGYLTEANVVGLSKFARIAHQAAHRLQLQERLVYQVAETIARVAGTENVAVIGAGSHLCMEMRGIRTAGEMITSHLGGRFQERDLRAEFLALHHG